MDKKIDSIAIDGVAGVGKSTISKMLAKKLGWKVLETGAIYRAITASFLAKNYDIKDGYVYISEDEKFTEDNLKFAISNIYTIDMPLLGECKNDGVRVFIIGMLIADAILVLTLPKKKKNK
jgi:cytidylate kinase